MRAKGLVAGLLVAALVSTTGVGSARAAEKSLGEQYGLGLVAGFGTLPYFPLKMVYATLGGLIGGLTYLVTLGNAETANAVWQGTLGGDYVLTPGMIAGEESVDFIGPSAGASKEGGNSSTQWPE